MAEFAEVVLNLPIDRAFTYRIPGPLRGVVRPGVRVRVPFRNGRERILAAGFEAPVRAGSRLFELAARNCV